MVDGPNEPTAGPINIVFGLLAECEAIDYSNIALLRIISGEHEGMRFAASLNTQTRFIEAPK